MPTMPTMPTIIRGSCKRNKIEHDSSEDENTSWIDSWWEEHVSQRSHTTEAKAALLQPPSNPASNATSPAAVPSPIGRSFEPEHDVGPFRGLPNPNDLFAGTDGGHRVVLTMPNVEEVDQLKLYFDHIQRQREGQTSGQHDVLSGPDMGPAFLSDIGPARYGPVLYPPIPKMPHRSSQPYSRPTKAQELSQMSGLTVLGGAQKPATMTLAGQAPMNGQWVDGLAQGPETGHQPDFAHPPWVLASVTTRPAVTQSASSPCRFPHPQPNRPAAENPDVDTTMPQHQHLDGYWSCRYEGCSNRNQRHRLQSDLRKHQRNHEKKKFICDMTGCDFAARFAGHLSKHKQSKHGDAKHSCPGCPKGYPRHDNLRRHMRSKHLGMPVPDEVKASTEAAPVEVGLLLQQPGPQSRPVSDPMTATTPSAFVEPDAWRYRGWNAVTDNQISIPSKHPYGHHGSPNAVSTYQQLGTPFTPTRRSAKSSPSQAACLASRSPSDSNLGPYFHNSPSAAHTQGSTPAPSYPGLPTPPLSRGASVARFDIRSRSKSIPSPPQIPSSEHRAWRYPLYSVLAASMASTPPSSEASAPRRDSMDGHHHPKQSLVYQQRGLSPTFGVGRRV